ncbi:unnamed protein product, partial [Pylaiella littoralis]
MSWCSWRSAEALRERQRTHRAIQRADERVQRRWEQATEEWHITGEPAFSPKERNYPHGGGVDGATCGGFLGSVERAIHLHDSRGKTLTREMSVTLDCLGRRHKALTEACEEFCDKHSSHLHPDRTKSGKWEVGTQELRLFVEAAGRMTSAQRHAFTNALAPRRSKSDGYIGPVEPLATSLQRANKASIEQAISGELFSA